MSLYFPNTGAVNAWELFLCITMDDSNLKASSFVVRRSLPTRDCWCAENVHRAEGWQDVLWPIVGRYEKQETLKYFRADAVFAKSECMVFWKEHALIVLFDFHLMWYWS